MSIYTSTYPAGGKHPLTAAALSLLPGLGQLYVGQRRKGLLFIEAGMINLMLLLLMFNADPIAHFLLSFGAQWHLRVNSDVVSAVSQFHFGSPASIMLVAAVLAFAWYAARDAYDHAVIIRRRKLYADAVIELSEASSGSYLLHLSLIAAFAITSLFFVMPVKHESQIVEIIVDAPTSNTKIKPKTENVSRHANVRTGAARPSEIEHRQTTPVQQATSPAKQQPKAAQRHTEESARPTLAPVAHPVVQAAPQPKPMMPNLLASAALPAPALKTLPTTALPGATLPSAKPLTARGQVAPPLPVVPRAAASLAAAQNAPLPVPHLNNAAGTSNAGVPAPTRISTGSGLSPSDMAVPSNINQGGGAQGVAPAPVPVAMATDSATGREPAPVMGRSAPRHGTGSGTNVAPVRAMVGDPTGTGPMRLLPVVPRSGETGEPLDATGFSHDRHGRFTPASQAEKSVDFTAFMAELQRRIRHHWFPPKDSTSRTIVVIFSVSQSGNCTNVRIKRSSGRSDADNAALQAIQGAFPFRHLPDGAPESVDIEFTFDYNVFSRQG